MVRFVSFWLYPLLAIVLIATAAARESARSPLDVALWFGAGLLGWTLLEYLLHRFFFHYPFKSAGLRRAREDLHLVHHAEPRNLDHLFVRPRYSLPISAFFLAAFWVSTQSLFSAASLMVGMWAGFLYYEAVHYRLHLTSSQGWVLKGQRRRHFFHHFVDADRCFGVTSPLWDYLLRTHKKASKSH